MKPFTSKGMLLLSYTPLNSEQPQTLCDHKLQKSDLKVKTPKLYC